MGARPSQIVVVGSGAAGLAAALTAAEEARASGRRCRIVLIDRAERGEHGGNTRWSLSYMRMASTREVAPGFAEDLHAVSGGRTDAEYVTRLMEAAPSTIAWLEQQGIAFEKPIYYLSAGPPRIQPVGGGRALVETLTSAAEAADVEIRYACAATGLVSDDDGNLSGLDVATAGGQRETLSASAVVLATGGFTGNSALLDKHLGSGGSSLRLISPGTKFNTGGGIEMALACGALASGDWQGMHAEPVDARCTGSAPVVLVYPYGIVVDRTGSRFFDEGAGLVHESWEHFARDIHFRAPGRIVYAILDAKLRAIDGYQRAIRSDVPPVEAASIRELAQKLGLPPAALDATVSVYNAAATGDASRFDATQLDGLASAPGLLPPKSNWCRALDTPPFLAYPLAGAIAYTFGGVATDADARVLNANGPIGGLYAAGEMTGHFYGTAPNAVAMLRALVFGRIAGARAVRDLA